MTMQATEFYLVYDNDGNVAGDMDQETARDRYNDDFGNEEFTVRKIIINIPATTTPELTMPETEVAVSQ
jgi:hypothetical protein